MSCPTPHVPPVGVEHTHAPALQVLEPTMPGGQEQTFPHDPQLIASLCRFVQLPLQLLIPEPQTLPPHVPPTHAT
jgi:hypothetical protein